MPATPRFNDMTHQFIMQASRAFVSKAVDAAGKPLVVYHSTGADITVFSDAEGSNFDDGDLNVPQDGIWFADDADRAHWFAGQAARRKGGAANIVPVYLEIKNPYVYTAHEFADEGMGESLSGADVVAERTTIIAYNPAFPISSTTVTSRAFAILISVSIATLLSPRSTLPR